MKIFILLLIIGFLVHMFFYWFSRSTPIRKNALNLRLAYYLPEFDSSERHQIRVEASPAQVYQAIHHFDMRQSKIINALVLLRSIPERLINDKKTGYQIPTKLTLDQITKPGTMMILLEEIENQEIVLGFGGKFWHLRPKMIDFSSPDDFISFKQPGFTKSAWNFLIERNDDQSVTLFTETRNLCLGEQAKSRFPLYWAVIRPYSGWIRLQLLKLIKRQAENQKFANLS